MQDIASDHAVLLGYGRDDLMKESFLGPFENVCEISDWPHWKETILVRTGPQVPTSCLP